VRRRRAAALLGAVVAAVALAAAPPARADIIRDAQWHLDDLRLPAAWRISRGAGVTIAILDTGVDPRSDSVRGRVRTGPDYVGSGAKRGDRYWGRHGTDIATVAAGAGRRPGAPNGVLGVAPEARILSVRVIAEDEDPEFGETGRSDGVALAIRYAVDHGAGVINMSFGAPEVDGVPGQRDERAAIRYALSRGVVVVASAGNEGDPADRRRPGRNRVGFPAGYAGVIAVGAARRDHSAAAFSTRHTYVTLAAPGVDIVDRADASFYYLGDGTSQAAAVVSGTVALVKAKYPKLSPAQIQRLLIDTASNRPKGGHGPGLGYGIVNPLGALRRAAAIAPRPAAAVPRYQGPRYFGQGPDRPAPAAASKQRGPVGRRLLLGGIGIAVLLPAPWLLVGGARSVVAARRRRRGATAEPGDGSPAAAGSAAWAPPEQRQPDQHAEGEGDQQGQPERHDDERHHQPDGGDPPVLEHEHQRHDHEHEHGDLPPPEAAAAP
jgi:type VII secretion-associated serine protease mycosin